MVNNYNLFEIERHVFQNASRSIQQPPSLLEYYHFTHFPEKQSSFSCEFVAARADPIANNERDYNRRGRAARGENSLAPCTQHTSPIRTPLDPRWRHIGPRRIATKVDVSISHDRNEQRHAVVTPMSILLSLGNVVGPRFIIRTRVPCRYTRSIRLVFRRIIRVHRLPLFRSNRLLSFAPFCWFKFTRRCTIVFSLCEWIGERFLVDLVIRRLEVRLEFFLLLCFVLHV